VLASGCCGMAGTYGHEARHRATSERIYALSWQEKVTAYGKQGRLLATGYSCRSQAKLIDGVRLQHPAQALLSHLQLPVATGAAASWDRMPGSERRREREDVAARSAT